MIDNQWGSSLEDHLLAVVDGDIHMKFKHTKTAPALIEEVITRDCYDIRNLVLGEGDIVDLGANEGMFTVWASLKWPEKKVIPVEPVERTYTTLMDNAWFNSCVSEKFLAYNFGVGPVGKTSAELVVSKDYSGGSSGFITFNEKDHIKTTTPLMTVDQVFSHSGIEKCALMKVDIEGAEYEALYAATIWDRVDQVVLEVHMNRRLEYEGRRPDGLLTWLSNRIKLHKVIVCPILE